MLGAKWITEQRPTSRASTTCSTRARGAVMPYGDRRLYGVCVAEKGTFRFNVSTTGTAAHASVPGLADNALLKLAPLITQLGEGRPGFDLTEATHALRRGARRGPGRPGGRASRTSRADRAEARAAARRRDAASRSRRRSSPRARRSTSSRPARRCASTAASRRRWARTSRSRAPARCSATTATSSSSPRPIVGNRSPVESKLMDAIGDWVGEHDAGAEAVPTVLPAFTDCRWFRAAFPDCVAYGFFPQRHQTVYETWPLMHAARRAHRRARPRLRRRLLPRPPREAPCRCRS